MVGWGAPKEAPNGHGRSGRVPPLGPGRPPADRPRSAVTVTRTVVQEIAVGAIRVELERPADAESLIDEQRFEDDEFLPYWAEQWPSGLALAEHLSTLPVEGARILELGCGLGLPSLVGAKRGAIVVATDWSSDALALLAAKRGAQRHHRRDAGGRLATAGGVRGAGSLRPRPGGRRPLRGAECRADRRRPSPPRARRRSSQTPAVATPRTFLDAVRMQGWAVTTAAHAQIPRGGIHRLEPSGLRPS